ncbi:ABC transporter permease [Rhizobium tubonense]|uniref:Sugar ABC transporter permease n=1 Tax=Rhizobium tubonense TaxID=484088 RepID=A0A2W4C310_9HYPH|nr:ABC transporter permease [Rhizobium tubonense]PZM08189.1 sugar ABC transporter permease [Rhizobium tubonense]
MIDVSTAAAPRRLPQFSLAKHGAFLALLALLAFNLLFTPHFASLQTFNVNMTQVAPIVIVAVGMTLVIATAGIDLSVGSLMAVAGQLAPLIFLDKVLGLPVYLIIPLAFIVPLIVTTLLGLFNGILVSHYRIQPIVATLVLYIAGRGIAQVLTNGNLVTFREPNFQWIGLARPLGVPVQSIAMVIFVVAAIWLVRKTLFGRSVLAVGGNETAAYLSGMSVGKIKRRVYMISGLCAGFAGLIVIAINSSSDANQVGLGMELDAIAAVAVGGTPFAGGKANLVGTLLGALIIQLVRYSLIANGVPDAAALVVKAGLIVLAVWLQRHGKNG